MQKITEFINVEEIAEDILYSHDGYMFAYISVKARIFENLMADEEKLLFYNNLTTALSLEQDVFQIISVPKTIDTIGMLSYLQDMKNKCMSDSRLTLLDGEMQSVRTMEEEGLKEPNIYIKIWAKASKVSFTNVNKRIETIIKNLTTANIQCERLKNQDITHLCKVYSDLAIYHDTDEEDFDLPILTNTERKHSKKDVISELESLIIPANGFEFKSNMLRFGNVYGKVYAVTKYPSEVNGGFLVDILNNTQSITAITFNPKNSDEIATRLSIAIRRNALSVDTVRDYRERKSMEKEVSSADEMLDRIDDDKQTIGVSSIYTFAFSESKEKLDDVGKSIVNLYNRQKIKIRAMSDIQQDLFRSLTPYNVPVDKVLNITNQIMPLHTLGAGSPMTITDFRDNKGVYFGKTDTGSIISLDLDIRTKDRVNSNCVVIGKPGGGKSTFIKHQMQTDFMKGSKIIVIDPEAEYIELCRSLGGDVFDTAGGSGSYVNILEVKRPIQDDEVAEEIQNGVVRTRNGLDNHIRTIETFFSLYKPTLRNNDILLSLLRQAIIEMYEKFGINWETDLSNHTSKDYPVFEDLHQYLLQKGDEYNDLKIMFKDIATGADSFLWNGHTNIETDNQFIVFNTQKLVTADDNTKRAQYYNILSMAWDIIEKNPTEYVALYCDEVYLMIDNKIPESLISLKNIQKRCRKKTGKIVVATHNITDFLDPAIKKDGQGLIDDPTYKVFFGLQGKSLKEVVENFELTQNEEALLSRGEQGTALFFCGSTKMKVHFDIPKYKMDLMGTAGGR